MWVVQVLLFCSAALGVMVPAARAQDPQASAADQSARPQAIEYDEGYETRAKIHKYASIATLPLFATEFYLGQHLYDDPQSRTSAARGAHIAVGTGITALFGVNSVTGIWNMWDSRHDPHHRTLRLVHGILMLGADGGFVATFATGPGHGRASQPQFDSNKATHRAVAFTSIGVATASYLMMLIGNR
jgi:hypothetical protein